MRAAIYRRDPRLYFETGHILFAKLAFPPAIYVARFEEIAAKIDNFVLRASRKNLKKTSQRNLGAIPSLYEHSDFDRCVARAVSFVEYSTLTSIEREREREKEMRNNKISSYEFSLRKERVCDFECYSLNTFFLVLTALIVTKISVSKLINVTI